MFQVCVEAHFDAAHFLRDYQGKCANLHGHRWNVEVVVEGPELDELGMLVDFGEIKPVLARSLKELDHSLLNDFPFFGPEGVNPTAENLALFLFQEIKRDLPLAQKSIAWVKVYESPETWAIYKED